MRSRPRNGDMIFKTEWEGLLMTAQNNGMTRRSFVGLMGMAFAAAAVVPLAGCSSSGDGSSDSGSESQSHKAAMIINGPMNDGGWFAACYEAMTGAADDLGWDTAYSENVDQADYVTTMQNYVNDGFDLILLPGQEYEDAAKQVAKDNPDAKFAVLMGTDDNLDGIEGMYYDDAQVGKLAGCLAMTLTATKNVAFIGGQELDNTQAKLAAYKETVEKLDSDAQVMSVFVGSFSDVAKGKEAGSVFFNQQNVDVLFGDANAEETGAIEALHEAVEADGVQRYVIGLSSDLGGADDDTYANSIILDHKVMFEEAMKDAASGSSFGNKAIKGDLDSGAVRMGTFSDKLVSADKQSAFNDYVTKIQNGEI